MAEAWNSDISSLAGTQAHHSKSIFCPHKSFNLSSHLKEPFFIGRKSRGCEEGIDVIRTHICFNLSSICNIRVILNGSQITPLSLIASTFLSLSEVIPFIWQKTEGDGQPAKPLCVISTVCSTDLICELSDWWHAQWETFFFFFQLKKYQTGNYVPPSIINNLLLNTKQVLKYLLLRQFLKAKSAKTYLGWDCVLKLSSFYFLVLIIPPLEFSSFKGWKTVIHYLNIVMLNRQKVALLYLN